MATKPNFMEQRAPGPLRIWAEPFVHLRTDPFERADITSNIYYDWLVDHGYIVFAAQGIKDFPPRQKAASVTIDQAREKMAQPAMAA